MRRIRRSPPRSRRARHDAVALATLLALAPLAAAAQSPAPPSAAAKVLLDQATYWRSQNQPQEAGRALDRLLRLEPDNPDALALQAQLQAEQGDRSAAQATLAHLRQVNPSDPHIAQVEQAIRLGSVDPAGIAEARKLAAEGHNTEAVARYKRLFRGSEPPDALAAEYYATLAGTEGGWEKARDGLARLVAANPRDARAQLAYAQLLTYREQTRLEGVQRLEALAKNPGTATAAAKAWRQALEWLPIDTPSIPAYQDWMAAHADDTVIAARLEQARNPPRSPADLEAAKRSDGFAALNAGRVRDAEAIFRAVLDGNPQDADALGGLGLVRLRQGNAAEARDLLSRAIAADPEHKARWEQALAGASIGDEYAAARAAMQHGQLNAAERQLRAIIARGGDVIGAQQMLADVLRQRGDLAGAESQYRGVLARQPNNGDAMVGLAQVLSRQGRAGEADALLQRAENAGQGSAAGRIRADALRQQAAAAKDPVAKEALLRAAVAAQPHDPWTRLDLARALLATGRHDAARAVMAEVTDAAHPGTDALRAGALFATEDGRPQDAAALVARLPAAARTADMQALLAQAQLQTEIRNAMSLAAVSPAAAREKLLTLAAKADPDGARGVAIAKAFLEMRNPAGAREALATAQAATRSPTVAQRIAYAGMLLQSGDDRGAQILIHALDGATGLTAQQATDLNRLRAGAAIREADALNAEGRQADAYDVLAPVLARSPDDPDLNMAVARLYARADQPRKALAVNESLLLRDPGNMDARQATLSAAIQARDWPGAERLVRDGMQIAPDDPRVWMMSASLHRARGNDRRALQDLRHAASLRRQAIGADAALGPAGFMRSPAADGPQAPAATVAFAARGSLATPPMLRDPGIPAGAGAPPAAHTAAYAVSTFDDTLVPPAGNPFRRSESRDDTLAQSVPAFAAPTPRDPMLHDIDRQMAALQQDLAPKFTFGPTFRSRTGTAGLDQLNEVGATGSLVLHPFGRGDLTLSATPSFLSAGEVPGDTKSQQSFGTGALGNRPAPPTQHAEGVGFDIGYRVGWAAADVGISPVGFQEQNILGGIELAPEIADGVHLRITGERRAVTDSLLSYAGTKDPGTGTAWGGVTRMRGHAQIEFSLQGADIYVGGGYAKLTGANVAENTEYEFGAGGSYPIWHNKTDELRIGLDLVYFGYDKNLRFFSLGQGGYFSPQSYFATLIPVHYTSRGDTLTWSVGGSLGYQTYNEHASAVFPNNPALQSSLLAAAAGTPGLLTSYPSRSAAGIVGGAEGSIEYRISDTFRLGGRATYQHAGDWSEASGTLFARYILLGE